MRREGSVDVAEDAGPDEAVGAITADGAEGTAAGFASVPNLRALAAARSSSTEREAVVAGGPIGEV